MQESKQVKIPLLIWRRLILHLRRVGQSRRESGAFLLASTIEARVVDYIPYEQIDPQVMDSGIIRMRAHLMVKLWKLCEQRQNRVIADIHSHPGVDTSQSPSDKDHPMIPKVGHTALIVPRYAQANSLSFSGVGVHRYEGSGLWLDQTGSGKGAKLTLL